MKKYLRPPLNRSRVILMATLVTTLLAGCGVFGCGGTGGNGGYAAGCRTSVPF